MTPPSCLMVAGKLDCPSYNMQMMDVVPRLPVLYAKCCLNGHESHASPRAPIGRVNRCSEGEVVARRWRLYTKEGTMKPRHIHMKVTCWVPDATAAVSVYAQNIFHDVASIYVSRWWLGQLVQKSHRSSNLAFTFTQNLVVTLPGRGHVPS